MKRSPMPPRKRPLARSWMSRRQRTRIRVTQRRGQPPEIALEPSRPRIDPALRRIVYERADGRCDLCGGHLRWEAWDCHHRLLRSQGGPDHVLNLVALCKWGPPSCHIDLVHGRPRWARDHGFVVPSHAVYASTPLWRHGRFWHLPTVDGWVPAGPIVHAVINDCCLRAAS